MANKGAKKRKDENEKHMERLRYVILIANGVYLLVRIAYFYSSVSWKHFLGFLVTSAAYKLSYDQLHDMSKPTYDDNGELIDGGLDMSLGGLCGYIHDVIYITSFVQVASVVSDKFWYIYLVIPLFALYKLWQLVLHPWIFQQSNETEDEKTKKKRERKSAKVKFAKMKR